MSSLPNSFKTYLKLQKVSPVTVRNYLADINHFLAWLELKIRSRNLPILDGPEFIKLYFTQDFIFEYKKYLLSNSLPFATINRRLSALRTFGKFCLEQAWLQKNPAKEVTNVQKTEDGKQKTEKVLEEFREHLEAEKTSSNTIRNYLSDIRAFLTWVEILGT